MNITIYQINLDRDTNRVAFESLETLRRLNGNADIDSSLYDRVYEAEVECADLEDVYEMFNLNRPKGYTGRSLSVSDIVEVKNTVKVAGIVELTSGEKHEFCDFMEYMSYQDTLRDQGMDFTAHDCFGLNFSRTVSEFYFCDSIGFKKVSFQPDLASAIEGRVLHVVLCEPGKLARIADIPVAFKQQQAIVGGNLHTYRPYDDGTVIVYNENGLVDGLPNNRVIRKPERVEDLSYHEMCARFRDAESAPERKHLMDYIIFSQESYSKPYSEAARTYAVSSENKAFQPNMGGYSIFGSAIDGSDPSVRLDNYMADEKGGENGWKIERCYTKEQGREILEVIAGAFFICGTDGEEFSSLSDEQAKKYLELFKFPERIFREGGDISALPYKPSEKAQER